LKEEKRKMRWQVRKLLPACLVVIIQPVLVNIILATSVTQLYDISPEDFAPLQWWRYILFTLVGAIGAIVVYAVLPRYSKKPVQTFHIIALVVLLLSFVPNLLMLSNPEMPTAGVIGLMLMHIPPYAASVIALPVWGSEPKEVPEEYGKKRRKKGKKNSLSLEKTASM
jgi:uncharacterized BrkB/YihY/UPF0761 family membrane protein